VSFCIVTTYIDKSIFKQYLVKSLKEMQYQGLLLSIFDKYREETSVGKVFNKFPYHYLDVDYLVFCHDDIRFKDKETFSKISKFLDEYNTLGGLAGVSIIDNQIYGLVTHDTPIIVNRMSFKPVEAITLDSICLFMPIELFNQVKFCEEYFKTHMLAEDYCLRVRYNLNKIPYILTIPVHHRGISGHEGFKRSHEVFYKKWHQYPDIYATVGKLT